MCLSYKSKTMLELCNFISLSQDEHKMILSWRNSQDVRKFMKTRHKITLKEHINFIKMLKSSSNSHYFLAKKDEIYYGVVSLVGKNLGIYKNPNLNNVGKELLKSLVEFSFCELKKDFINAEVYLENQKAIKLYENFGFRFYEQTSDMKVFRLYNNLC